MQITQIEIALEELAPLLYKNLKDGDGFTMFENSNVRFRTIDGHVAFEPQNDGTFRCNPYKECGLFNDQPVVRLDAEIQWWRI